MNLLDFDRIHCVCLDYRRKDWPRLTAEFQERGAIVQRFVVGKGKVLPKDQYDQIDPEIVPSTWHKDYSLNAYGCYLAHRTIIEKAQKDSVETLLILEDDCHLTEEFDTVLEKATKQIQENDIQWDMLYYGLNLTWGQATQISKNVLRLNKGVYCWHCVAIKSNMFNVLLELKPEGPMDWMSAYHIQPFAKCYGIWPNIATQLNGFSYINGQIEDYSQYFINKGHNEIQ